MLQRVLVCAVILGIGHSFCPAARSVCQNHLSAEPADAVGDEALVTTSETTSTGDIATAAAAGATAVSAVASAAGTVLSLIHI